MNYLYVNIVIIVTAFYSNLAKATDYTFVTNKFEKVVEDGNIMNSDDLKYETKDGEIIFNGELKQLVDLDNSWQVKIIVERSTMNEKFITVMSFPPMGVCSLMATHYKKHFYDSLKMHSNAPDPDKCPVTADTYTVKDYAFETKLMRKQLKPGQYRIKAILSKNHETKVEYVLEGEIIEA